MRLIWLCFGCFSLALGVIGIFLPLLPTVPLLLLAAFCFSKSSERLHKWLIDHPKLGPPILDWRKNGVIRRKFKYMATASIALVFGLSLWFGVATHVLIIQAVTLGCVMIFIWSRPEEAR